MKFKEYKEGADLSILSPNRPPAMGVKGAVTSPHYLASQVGQDILKKGGHAVDAVIAMNAVLTVVYPHMAGLGGDAMAIIYHQENEKIESINGSGASGEKATSDFYKNKGYDEIPERGPLSSNTVPGAVGAWWEMHQKHGKLKWKEILAPALHYAEEGFPMSQKLVNYLREEKELLSTYEETKKIFVADNSENPKEGDILKQLQLAETYRKLMKGGADAFYKGEIADLVVKDLQAQGGLLTKKDFADYRPEWSEPLSTQYRGAEVLEMRPNTQGLTTLIILNILQQFDMQSIGDNSADYYHLMAEATKLAFVYKEEHITDEEEMEEHPESFVQPEIGEKLAEMFSRKKSTPGLDNVEKFERIRTNRDTTYFAAVDNEGNAVSMIQSIFFEFGSGFVPKEAGFILQNRGSFFDLEETEANELKPSKRTFHTIMPAMILKNKKPLILLGTMGGEGQPQTQTAIITRILDYDYNIQEAIEAPRWLYGKTWGSESQTLKMERRISQGIMDDLMMRGQEIEIYSEFSDTMGHAQGITINQETNVLAAGADPRGDGSALSW